MLTFNCMKLNVYLPALCWHPIQICVRKRRLGLYLPLTDLILSDDGNPLLQTIQLIKPTLTTKFNLKFHDLNVVHKDLIRHLEGIKGATHLIPTTKWKKSFLFDRVNDKGEVFCCRKVIVFDLKCVEISHWRQCSCPGFSISSCVFSSNSSLTFPSWNSHCSSFLGGGQSFFCSSSRCWRETVPHLNHVWERLQVRPQSNTQSHVHTC